MTKKDYNKIASMFKQEYERSKKASHMWQALDNIRKEMKKILKEDNIRFDPERFDEACLPDNY